MLCWVVLDVCWQRTRLTQQALGNLAVCAWLCWICVGNARAKRRGGHLAICVGFVLNLGWQHTRQTQQALRNLAMCWVVLDLCWIYIGNTCAKPSRRLGIWQFVLASEFGFCNTKRATHPGSGGGRWCPFSIIVRPRFQTRPSCRRTPSYSRSGLLPIIARWSGDE